MNLGLTSQNNEKPYEPGKDFTIGIACENCTTAALVCEVLEAVERNLKDESRLFYQWWNFDVLTFLSWREEAAAEAAKADMIFVCIHEGRELPEMVAAWMKRCFALRKYHPGALVAVLDSRPKKSGGSGGILSQLKRAAASAQMDFFAIRAKESGAKAVTRKVGEAARQFVKARKNGAQNGLPGGTTEAVGNMPQHDFSRQLRL